jgi:hypothetical protein
MEEMLQASTTPKAPPPTEVPTPLAAAPPQWHRGITVLAVISMFIGTRSMWTHAMAINPFVAGLISVCYAAILVLAVLTLTVRSRKSLGRVDLAVLILAITLAVCAYVLSHTGSDESVLTSQAAREIVSGHAVYGQPWPWLFNNPNIIAVTPTMSGGTDYTYGYPPLAPLLTAPVYLVTHSMLSATVVGTVAIIAATIALWVMLPAPWRSAAPAVCLGFGTLASYGRLGYPAILALAFLIPVVIRWPAIGAGGRLGRPGIARAICLGAACAAQQLPWFLTPFLLVGIYAVRRGELGARPALAVVARLAGIAAATWLAINAYFIVTEPSTWLGGIALPLTQGALIHGQGLVDISFYFTNGSGRLDFYSYSSSLLLLGLIALSVLFIRRLGPAATVLPWCAFYFATRSQDGYYLMMTPLWVAAAATVPSSAFASAWQPRLSAIRGRTPRLAAVTAAVLTPATACVAIAAFSGPPLHLDITAVHTKDRAHREISTLTFYAANTTGSALTPHFAVSTGQGTSAFWTVLNGPTAIPAHGKARYVLQPPGRSYLIANPGKRLRLRVFTPTPMTISSTDIPVPAAALKAAAGK